MGDRGVESFISMKNNQAKDQGAALVQELMATSCIENGEEVVFFYSENEEDETAILDPSEGRKVENAVESISWDLSSILQQQNDDIEDGEELIVFYHENGENRTSQKNNGICLALEDDILQIYTIE